MTFQPSLHPLQYEPIVRRALEEDLGRAGDLTTDTLIDPASRDVAHLVAREAGCVAGLLPALSVFQTLDESLVVVTHVADGTFVAGSTVLATIRGSTRALLSGERVALNILGRMCGIATTTNEAVRACQGTKATIVCTRKTVPGLRALEKYAVRMGGGGNHRFGLDDGILIKDNHIAAVGGIEAALTRVKARSGHMVKVEIEVDTLDQLDQVLAIGGADAVLLDNMDVETLEEAVKRVDGRLVTEASGGITPDRVAVVAGTGVDLISLGWLTHSVRNSDVALEIDEK
ncbi:MAG: carboxylating nicotinate-nucleotide diphosphorylase [Rhodospirillales bacterium]|nr:carboxylating nicotinate-nucleotide diphosphorylase [Rhodospirillales bacterium]